MDEQKVCSRCKEEKPLSAFHKGQLYRGGYNARCKACRSEIAAAAYRKDPAFYINRGREWEKRNDPDGSKRRGYAMKYSRAHGVKPKRIFATPAERDAAQAEYQARYVERNAEKVRASKRAYEAMFPERVAMAKAQNKAHRRDAPGEVTGRQWREILFFYGHACGLCKTPEAEKPLTVDHFMPIAKGGTHEWTNVWPLCLPCNMRKKVAIPDASAPPHVAAMLGTITAAREAARP